MSAAPRFDAIRCENKRDELVRLAKRFSDSDPLLGKYAAELRAMVGRLEDDIEKARAEERNREPQPQNVNGSMWFDDDLEPIKSNSQVAHILGSPMAGFF